MKSINFELIEQKSINVKLMYVVIGNLVSIMRLPLVLGSLNLEPVLLEVNKL